MSQDLCVCVCMCVQTDGKTDTLYRSVSRCQKGKASERKTLLDNAQHIERQYCFYRFFFCFFFCCRSWSNISPQIRFRFCTNWRSFSEFHSLNPFDSLILTVSSLNPSLETWAYPSMHWAEGKKTSWPCKPVQNLSYTGYLDFAEALMMSYSDFPFSSAPHPSEQS